MPINQDSESRAGYRHLLLVEATGNGEPAGDDAGDLERPLDSPSPKLPTDNSGLSDAGFLMKGISSPNLDMWWEGWPEDGHTSRISQWCNFLIILPGAATGRWFLESWDLFIVLLVVMVAYYEPFAIALYRPNEMPWWTSYFDVALTLAFTTDMGLHFFIATPHAQDSLHKDLWEKDICHLTKHYMNVPCRDEGRAGWFWIDLLSVIPGWWWIVIGTNYANPLLLLRIFRLFQTVRLQRLTRLAEIAHSLYGFPFFVVEIAKFFAITTITCHWMACLWVLVEGKITNGLISYTTASSDESWLSALILAKGDTCTPNVRDDPVCAYILAYYWAAMTLTSVGYGDITPQNKVEYMISIACMFIVGYIWAFIVGMIVSTLSNLDPASTEFKHSLDELGHLMSRRGLPRELQVRLRTYMHETRHFMHLNGQRKLVEKYFSDGLQREVAKNSAEVREMLRNVYWMREFQEDAILDIVRALRPKAYGPNELINLRGSMIIMQRGIAGVKGRIISRGDVWGHNDILMETQQLIDGSMPRTLSFVELLMLQRTVLVEVGRNYPEADVRLRRAQIRTAVARAFIYQAKKLERSRTKLQSESARSSSRVGTTAKSACKPMQHESSFANPGMRRIKLRKSKSESSKNADSMQDMEGIPDDLRDVLANILSSQELIQQQLVDLQDEVRNRDGNQASASSVMGPARSIKQRVQAKINKVCSNEYASEKSQ